MAAGVSREGVPYLGDGYGAPSWYAVPPSTETVAGTGLLSITASVNLLILIQPAAVQVCLKVNVPVTLTLSIVVVGGTN